MKSSYFFVILFLVFSFACRKELIIDAGYGLDDWAPETHGEGAKPDYATVFPDDQVNRLDIIIDNEYWQIMQENLDEIMTSLGPGSFDMTPIYIPCQVFFEGKQWYDVGIRYKGNSSLMSAYREGIKKLPLRLEFDHFDKENAAINGQTFYGFSQLSLGNNFKDGSFIHEKTATDVYRDFGVPCSKSGFYRIYIDFGETPIYFGLYTMVEIVFDEPMLNEFFGNYSGNCFKPDGEGARLNNPFLINSSYFPNKTGSDASFSDIKAFVSVLLNDNRVTDPEQWRADLESVFNVNLFLKWLVANTTMQNWDTYGLMTHNYYLYNDPASGLLTWIPWDNNETFSDRNLIPNEPPAAKTDSRCLDFDFSNLDNSNPGPDGAHSWPLIRYIYDDPIYRQKYDNYLKEFLAGPFASDLMNQRFSAYHNLISKYVIGTEGENLPYTFLRSDAEFNLSLNTLIDFISGRHTEAQSYLDQP